MNKLILSLFALSTLASTSPAGEPSARTQWRPDQRDYKSVEFDWVGEQDIASGIESTVDAERAGRAAIDAIARLEGVPATDLVFVDARVLAGLWSIEFAQSRDGVPVRGARIDVDIAQNGTVLQVSARGLCRAVVPGHVVHDAEAARGIARAALDPDRTATLHIEPARAIIAWTPRGFVQAWEVPAEEPTSANGSWIVVVNAATGAVLEIEPRAVCAVSGTADGRGLLAGPSTTNPVSTLPMRNLTLTASDSAALLLRLTSNSCSDTQAVISADGSRVAYVSNCDGDDEIWTVLPDGTGATQLTFDTTRDSAPMLSADGSKVAFVSEVDGDPEIYVMNTNGTGRVQISTNTGLDEDPSLDGAGALVVWTSYATGNAEIVRSSTTTPVTVPLTFDAGKDDSPALSADGTRVVFVSDRDGDKEIFTMLADGTGLLQLTTNSVADTHPTLSGDGTLVVFQSLLPKTTGVDAGDPSVGRSPLVMAIYAALSADPDLFSLRTDGTMLTRLTESHAREYAPSLSTSGGSLAYVSTETGNPEIMVRNMASGLVVQMTNDSFADTAPSISGSPARGVWTVLDGDFEIGVWNSTASGALAFGVTNSVGAFTLPFPDGASPSISARLQGLYAHVVDEHPAIGDLRANASAVAPSAGNLLRFHPTGSNELAAAQVTAYHHIDLAHSKLSTILTRPPLSMALPLPIDHALKARVNVASAVPNAFYNLVRQDVTFFVGRGMLRPNTAYDTVIHHEYGHFFDDLFGGLGTGSACEGGVSLSEATGDIVALFTSGGTVIGVDWKGAGTKLRDYATPVAAGGSKGRQYDGIDCKVVAGKPEPHDHGEAFAGFANALRTALGPVLAENLVMGALASNPPNMQAAVTETFLLAAMPAFGGSGSPITSPLYGALCTAAAAHGFDCVPRADFESYGCLFPVCTATARHITTGTEWLGALVDFETGCETLPNPDDDGVGGPLPPGSPGSTMPITVTIKVNPALKHTGRYGGVVGGMPIRERLVYLNAWLIVDDPFGAHTVTHVLGTGSASSTMGPHGFPPNTVAFNPDTWAGDSTTFSFGVPMPIYPEDRIAVLRLRLDYGEDCGALSTCLSHADLSGPCGTARYGEVEDHQFVLLGM